MDVLFEKPGRRPGQAVGRTPYLQPVHVDGAAELIGQIHRVRIAEVMANSLQGELLNVRARQIESALESAEFSRAEAQANRPPPGSR